MITRACSVFIFFSPILLVALASILAGQFGVIGLIALVLIMISLLFATQSPPNALISPAVALKLITLAIFPLVFWSAFFWKTTASQSYLTLIFKSLMMVSFPLAICTRWSVIHVIALCELFGMGSLGHRMPAGCEQIILGGPIWLAESIEVFRALPNNCMPPHIRLRRHANQLMQVFQFGILKVIDVADFVATSKLFLVTTQGDATFVDMQFRRNLHVTTLYSIAILVAIVLVKV